MLSLLAATLFLHVSEFNETRYCNTHEPNFEAFQHSILYDLELRSAIETL